MATTVSIAQETFLRGGGIYAKTLEKMRRDGGMRQDHVHEYPKMLRVNERIERRKHTTRDIDRQIIEWESDDLVYDEVIVNSEEEEDRVLSGGKTAAQIEDEKHELMAQARSRGIRIDPAWGVERMKREIGAPRMLSFQEQPVDDLAAMEEKARQLEEKLAMMERLAALEAKIAALTAPKHDEADDLRAQLQALGRRVDMRWSVTRLRDELEAATAPSEG